MLALIGFASPSAHAAGALVASGPFGGNFAIEEHTADVVINEGIAVTTVRQTFRNLENRVGEALYIFPVPEGASVSNFSMWINGREMIGEVVEKQRARQIYESYKATRTDPGLLEQNSAQTFEMRIFPIPANGEQRIQITYYQELNVENDTVTWVYPLSNSDHRVPDDQVRGKFAVNVDVLSTIAIDHLSSPSHSDQLALAQHSEHYQRASIEIDQGRLNQDVVLRYRLAEPDFGFHMVTSRNNNEPGFYLATITAGTKNASDYEGRDYVFVLDTSGSMRNDGKLQLSKQAVDSFISTLSSKDRFEIITFNIQPQTVFGGLRQADTGNVSSGISQLNRAPLVVAQNYARPLIWHGAMLMPTAR